MNAVGLITEYNPFHNGHLHHLRESLGISGAEVAVAVMSGHFLQRGEPALADKWVRTQMALAAGVDVVVELPFHWACNSAPHFARGAVQALDALGGVASLCFGSESGQLDTLQKCATLLSEPSAELDEETLSARRLGFHYPAARSRALAGHPEYGESVDALGSPNNILGIAYLRALREERSTMQPLTIRRVGAGYHEARVLDGIASATGIRRMLAEAKDPTPYLPPEIAVILGDAGSRGAFADVERMLPLLLTRIFDGRQRLGRIYLVEDGIESRLQQAADHAGNYRDLVAAVKSRHLTRTRVQRLLAFVFNDVAVDDMAAFLETGPLYLHLLGVSPSGRAFLASSRKERRIPLIGNFSRIHSLIKRRYGADTPLHDLALRQLALELRATRNYTLLVHRWDGANRNRDFFEPRQG